MTDNMTIKSRFTAVNDAEEGCERTCAKLLIYSTDLTAKEITDILGGLQPTSDVQAKAPDGAYPGRSNGWFLSSEEAVKSKDLRTHLDWLTKHLYPHSRLLFELQQRSGIRMYVHCPWWGYFASGGPSLWPEQMKSLAELNLECAIDFAHYDDENA